MTTITEWKVATTIKTPRILTTTDYDQFQFLPENRPVAEINQALMAAIQSKNLLHLYPIVVDSHMNVIDGQNRLVAAKNLGLAIYYIIDDDVAVDDIAKVASVVKNWSLQDFFHHYCALRKPEYLKLRSFISEYPGVSMTVLVSNIGSGVESFRGGDFMLADDAPLVAKNILSLARVTDIWKRARFQMSMVTLTRNPNYDHERMMDRLRYQSTRLVPCAEISQYIELLNDIYNYRSRKKVDLTGKYQNDDDAEPLAQ